MCSRLILDKNFKEDKKLNMKKWLSFVIMFSLIMMPIPTMGISSQPLDSSCDAYGNTFVLDISGQKVLKFDKSLNYQQTVISQSQLQQMKTNSITVCWCAGEISFASSSTSQTKMFEIDPKNNYVFKRNILPVGVAKGQTKNPSEIVYLRSNDDYWVAVVDPQLGKIAIVDDYGKFRYEITGLSSPKACYFSTSKQIYAADLQGVKKYSTSGSYFSSFQNGVLNSPVAIDASKNEDLFFVLDGQNIKVFDKDGNYLRKFAVGASSSSLCVNQDKDWVIVSSSSDGGTLSAYDYSGKLQKKVINAANPKKEKIIIFTIGSYVGYVDGVGTKLRCPAKIENGRTIVPVKEIVEPLGGKASWDAVKRKVTISYTGPKVIEMIIGDPYATVDGKRKLMPSSVPPQIMCNGVTMVPLRFVSEMLGAQISYDDRTKTIEVKK